MYKTNLHHKSLTVYMIINEDWWCNESMTKSYVYKKIDTFIWF
jgi:hypothetical protein